MDILEKYIKLAQSTEEPTTMVHRGIKYGLVEDWWIPIQIMSTIRLIDSDSQDIQQPGRMIEFFQKK